MQYVVAMARLADFLGSSEPSDPSKLRLKNYILGKLPLKWIDTNEHSRICGKYSVCIQFRKLIDLYYCDFECVGLRY